jgi:hypothetical protein
MAMTTPDDKKIIKLAKSIGISNKMAVISGGPIRNKNINILTSFFDIKVTPFLQCKWIYS